MAVSQKISLAPLLAVNFVGTLGFSIVTPFLVILVTGWGGNGVVYGVMAATYSFFQLFGAPILGRMSDRIGRRRVLIYSQLGTLISWAIFLLAFALPSGALVNIDSTLLGSFTITLPLIVLFVARAADGLTGGNVSVSNAYLADITNKADRSKNYGQMSVSSNLGFIFGPALAGLLGATVLGEILPVMLAFAISAAALALIQFGLRDIPAKIVTEQLEPPSACDVYGQEHKPAYQVHSKKPGGNDAIFRLPNMAALMAINFLIMLGFSFFYSAFPVHAVQALGWSVFEMGTYFAVVSLLMVIVQGPILDWAAKRISDRALMAIGGAILTFGFFGLLSESIAPIYFSAAAIALGNGLMWPTFMSTLSKSADSETQGAVQGFAGSAGAIASILGLVGGGIIYTQQGAWAFMMAGIAIAVSAIIALTVRTTAGDDEETIAA